MSSITESLKITGTLEIKRFDADGNLTGVWLKRNLVVHSGKQYIIRRMKDSTVSPVRYMALGLGTTAPISSDVNLESEVTRLAIATPVDNDITLSFSGIFPPGNGVGEIAEAGLFNDPSAGTMLARTTFTPITKGVDDSFAISWHIAIS